MAAAKNDKSKDVGGEKSSAPAPEAPKADEPKASEPSEAELEELTAPRSTFHVPGPGAVMAGGEMHKPGAALELTASEAKALGASVKAGPPPKKRSGPAEAGRYRITGPGSICQGGKFRGPGYELDLSAAEAKAFSDRIEPA